MGRIPLIRASQAGPFLGAVRSAGLRVEPLVEASGLSPDALEEDPEAPVPEYAVWDLIDRCAAQVDAPHFGFEVGLGSSVEGLGAFGRQVGSAPTLGAALELFLHAVQRHSSHARFSVVRQANRVWFRRHGIDRIDVGAWQVEQYVLGIMVNVARLTLGAAWAPDRVLLKRGPLRGMPLPAVFRDAHVQRGAGVTAIELPAEALGRSSPRAAPAAPSPDSIELDLAASVRLGLRHALPSGRAGLDYAARLAGVSARTLQRWLWRGGHVFGEMLDDLRREEALRLLAESGVRIVDVAARLGYADQANFTRAFRRWTGKAPSVVRAEVR